MNYKDLQIPILCGERIIFVLLVNWLLPNKSCKRNERLPKNLGIGPTKLLDSKNSSCKFSKDAKSFGIGCG